MKRSKGQASSLDFVVATAMLFMVLILYILMLGHINAVSLGQIESGELLEANLDSSGALLLSGGDPANWNELPLINGSTVHSIGLAESRNVLHPAKVQKFVSLNSSSYEFLKESIGLSKQDFLLEIWDDDALLYRAGLVPPQEAQVSSLERPAMLNGSVVRVMVKVWR